MSFDFRQLTGLFIDGKWLTSDKQLPVEHKYTGDVIAEVAQADPSHVEQAAVAAERAMKQTPLSMHERYTILMNVARALEDNTETIARIITQESGKPIRDGIAEVGRAVQTITLSAEEAKRIHGESLPMQAMPGMDSYIGFTIRVPVGVVAAITPFNYPLNLVAHKIGPAIAAGNSVVLKPASTTPLSSIILCKLFQDAGLPDGYLNLVVGPGSTVGDALSTNERVRMITFTGSPNVGQRIKAMSGIKKVTLELGNNSPNIVHHDANIDEAVQALVLRAYAQAGQSCISVQRIYVHSSIYSTYLDRMCKATEALVVGDPEDPKTDVGPLITLNEAKRVEEWIQQAVEAGAEIVCGGKREGSVVQPTILTNVKPDMNVVCQEIFGPVVSVTPYESLEEVVAMSNDTVYGLQAGIFTQNLEDAWYAINNLDFGGVIVNDASSFRADLMPYGGVKQSGIGREGPRYAVEEMTELRNVIFKVHKK